MNKYMKEKKEAPKDNLNEEEVTSMNSKLKKCCVTGLLTEIHHRQETFARCVQNNLTEAITP